MTPDANGSKKWYFVARELIGSEAVEKLRTAGIALRCVDELRELDELCERQAQIIEEATRRGLLEPSNA